MQEFSNKYLGTKKLVSITKGIFSLRIEYFCQRSVEFEHFWP